MRLGRVAAAIVVASCGTLLVGPIAPARAAVDGSRIGYFQSTVTGSINQRLTVTAMCPAGQKVVSLGAFGTHITSLRPTTNFDGAVASGVATNGTSLSAVAGCVRAEVVQDVTQITLRVRSRTVGLRQDVQSCPAGRFAFGGGGGFTGSPSGGMSVSRVTPDGRGWAFAGFVDVASATTEIDVQCAPDDGTTFLVTATAFSSGAGFKTAEAVCPEPYFAFSGGAQVLGSNGTPADFPIVESQPGSRASWRVTGIPPAGGSIVAVARCIL